MPAAAQNPLARPRGFCGIAHHADDVVPAPGGAQLQVSRSLANAGEVRVRVDEPRYCQRAFQIDHARRGANQPLDFRVRSDRRDRVAGHGDGFDDGSSVVDGDDLSAAQHQIGSWDRRLRRRRHTQHDQKARNSKRCLHRCLQTQLNREPCKCSVAV
jgi:hypothetical protein